MRLNSLTLIEILITIPIINHACVCLLCVKNNALLNSQAIIDLSGVARISMLGANIPLVASAEVRSYIRACGHDPVESTDKALG